MNQKTVIIIPCYNEENRLKKNIWDLNNFKDIKFVFVNDGSTDSTSSMLEIIRNKNSNVEIISTQFNLGKGPAIKLAIDKIINDSNNIFEFIGYWDADLSSPLELIPNLVEILSKEKVDAVFGIRLLGLGYDIKRNPLRHYLGRVFITLASILLDIKAYDTQCGAKIFKRNIAQVAFSQDFISKWIFDLEIILRLEKFRVMEVPLKKWHHSNGSKLNLPSVAINVIIEMLKIKKEYKR